ncbi:MAG: rhomboid family intramembrane serine protease, partial [Gemmataceae bacterium]
VMTACFVHAGALHLLLNMFSLGNLGPFAETLWGRWRFIVLYALSGLASTTFAMMMGPQAFLVGASGAVCGVFGAIAAWLLLYREHLPGELVFDFAKGLALGAVTTIAVSFAPQVSWEGHLGGFVTGFITAILLNVIRPGLIRRRVMIPAALALVLFPVVCLTGLSIAMETGPSWAKYRQVQLPLFTPLMKLQPNELRRYMVECLAAPKTPALERRHQELLTMANIVETVANKLGESATVKYTVLVRLLLEALAAGQWDRAGQLRKEVEIAWRELSLGVPPAGQ